MFLQLKLELQELVLKLPELYGKFLSFEDYYTGRICQLEITCMIGYTKHPRQPIRMRTPKRLIVKNNYVELD